MGKISEKTSVKPAKKTTTSKPKASASPSPELLEKACREALNKLEQLDIEPQLRSDLEWCLGSYSHDKNPSGLYEKGESALSVLKAEKNKNGKSITTKFISDLEKALKR